MRMFLLVVLGLWCGCTTPGTSNVYESTLGTDARIAGDIMKYGYPGTAMVRYREGHVLSYDASRRVANWVAERLNKERLAGAESSKGYTFWVDQTLPEAFRSRSVDFADSGYIRGRLAAASNHRGSKLALKQTYLMSNVVPMLGADFRQTFWIGFEEKIREWARGAEDLYVFTGPLFLAETGGDGGKLVSYQVLGDTGVAVPSHFYKVMLREQGHDLELQAFIVPHKKFEGQVRYSDFLVSVDQVESFSGLDFFSGMDPKWQARVESVRPELAWGETHDTGAGCATDDEGGEEEQPESGCGCG